jgi:hypothetical protein
MKASLILVAVVIALIATTTLASSQAQLRAKFAHLFTETAEGGLDFSEELQKDLCEFSTAGGDDYNFNNFKGDDFTGVNPKKPTAYTYTLSFCRTAAEKLCAAQSGSVCQYDISEGHDHEFTASLASFTTAPPPTFSYIDPTNKSSGLSLVFKNGEKCKPSPMVVKDRILTLRLTCDKTAKERKLTIDETDECVYEVDVKSALACGNGASDGLSGGALFLIVVFSVILCYIVFGCIICVVKFGKSIGPDACPQKDFWCALPGFFVAGIGFTIGKIKGCMGSKTITTSSGEYQEA